MLVNTQLEYHIQFANEDFILHADGALYWPRQRLLIFADLHFEKGSYFAQRGNPLPLYDTTDTISRMAHCIDFFHPRTVLCLGDNIHDQNAMFRMDPNNYARLQTLCAAQENWWWIIGNHDREIHTDPLFSDHRLAHEIKIDHVLFTHDQNPTANYQVMGHYHPKLKISIQQQRISGKCFIVTQHNLLMPAYGSYTGGLDINSNALQKIHGGLYDSYLLKNNKIWHIKPLAQ